MGRESDPQQGATAGGAEVPVLDPGGEHGGGLWGETPTLESCGGAARVPPTRRGREGCRQSQPWKQQQLPNKSRGFALSLKPSERRMPGPQFKPAPCQGWRGPAGVPIPVGMDAPGRGLLPEPLRSPGRTWTLEWGCESTGIDLV